MNILRRMALLGVIAAAVMAAAGMYMSVEPADAGNALGGPVILGGDDLQDHGCNDGAGNNLLGWLYIQRALENIAPNVTIGNDGTIAALGSADVAGAVSCGDAGSAIFHAAQDVGLTVEYYNTGAGITQFFADLDAGTATPAIIWIAGTGASNDLGDDAAEGVALTTNAQAISDFVSQGGGLMSHGSEYGWLFALLPDASTVDGGSSDDLYFTPEGLADLPALTVSDINAGPWHNHFEGDFGGLSVLVRSNSIDDIDGQDAAVVLGGAQVTFEEQPDQGEEEPTATPCIPPLVGYRCDGSSGGGGGGGAVATPTSAPVQPTPVVSVAPATVVPPAPAATQPSGALISAPDTGDGAGSGGGGAPMAFILLGLAGIVVAGAGLRMKAARTRS